MTTGGICYSIILPYFVLLSIGVRYIRILPVFSIAHP